MDGRQTHRIKSLSHLNDIRNVSFKWFKCLYHALECFRIESGAFLQAYRTQTVNRLLDIALEIGTTTATAVNIACSAWNVCLCAWKLIFLLSVEVCRLGYVWPLFKSHSSRKRLKAALQSKIQHKQTPTQTEWFYIEWCVGPLMLAQNVDIALNVHTKRVSIFDRLICTFRFISTLFCPINVRCVCVYIAYRTYQKLLIFPIWKQQKRTTSTHTHSCARARTFVWHTHSHSIYIKCNWICSSPIVCLLWMPPMTIHQYLALKSLFLTDDDRTENVRTMNHKSTCNAHHHRLYEVLCISQLWDDFPISGHFLFRFFLYVSFNLQQSAFYIMVTDFSPLNTRGFSLIKMIAFDIDVSTHSWLSIEKSKSFKLIFKKRNFIRNWFKYFKWIYNWHMLQ